MNRSIKISLSIIVFTLCAALHGYAQHSLGFRGGYTIGLANIEPTKHMRMDMGNYEGALTYTYSGFQKNVGALQTEIIYSQRGYSYDLQREESDSVFTRKIRSVELPFLWRPYYNFSKDRGIVYAVIGTYVYYDISSDIEYKDLTDPTSSFNSKNVWEYDSLRDNRLGVGVLAGVGFGWNIFKQLQLSAEFRYAYGFSNVFRPAAQYEGNPVQSTTSKMTVSMSLTYHFNNNK